MPRLRPPYPVEQWFSWPSRPWSTTSRLSPTYPGSSATALKLSSVVMAPLPVAAPRYLPWRGRSNAVDWLKSQWESTIREIVEKQGGGVAPGRQLKAVQLGVVHLAVASPSRWRIHRWTTRRWQRLGPSWALGGMVVLDDRDCMVDICPLLPCSSRARSLVASAHFAGSAPGGCWRSSSVSAPGRVGRAISKTLEELADRVRRTSLCGLGQTAPNPVSDCSSLLPRRIRSSSS